MSSTPTARGPEGPRTTRAWRSGQPLSWPGLLLASGAVGVLLAMRTLHPGFILGGPTYWSAPWDDSAQSLAGLLAFVQDSWRFPLLSIATYGVPEGANAANLNAIPLVALVVKALYPLTHHVFVYFGLWIALCRVLHAVCGALLLSELGERRLLPVLTVSLLFAGLPSLLERITHADLSAQFLLPASLLLYRRVVRAESIRGTAAAGFVFLALALLIHPYFLVMTFLPYAAGLAERWRRGSSHALAVLGAAATQAAGLLVVLLACGHLGALESRFSHYGEWSMNLLSPFLLAESTLLPAARVLGTTQFLFPEGINYLGLGGIGLLAVVLLGAPRDFLRPLRRHPFLCAVLVGMAAFALSHRIHLGNTLLLTYPLPPPLYRVADVFRASGRFFWPVSVALLAWAVAVVARRLPARTLTAVLALVCGVQWVDLTGARDRSYSRSSRNPTDALSEARAAWSRLVTRHRAVEVYPSYCCGATEENEFDLQLQLIAVRARVITNSAYLSRPNKDCAREAEEGRRVLLTPVPPGVLRIFYRQPHRPAPETLWASDPGSCRVFDGGLGGIVCTGAWPDIEARLPVPRPFRPLGSRP